MPLPSSDGGSESGSDDGNPPMLSSLPEWDGTAPVPPPAGDGRAAAIALTPWDADALGLLRAVLAADERSPRALSLTEAIILQVNAAEYSAWEHRWRCVVALGADLSAEAALTARVAGESPKNYQLWNYRAKLGLARGPDHAEEARTREEGARDSE